MARTSPVHYIAPSAISITPNANNSHRDLAVYVTAGAKIKVLCPRAGIGYAADGTYQEWTLSGRNRRLADTTGAMPYTIYARLNKTGGRTGYLVFVKKTQHGNDWVDAYSSLTNDTANGYSILYTDNGAEVRVISPDYYYIRLGDVSVADNGQRTVTLDTGILGTDQFNDEWALNPDLLPLRIGLACAINNKDAGPTPYVYWGQQLVLSATLTEGWSGTDIQRFDHWEITRNSGDPSADDLWSHPAGASSYRTLSSDGRITLSHARGVGDDFNGAVSSVFTVIAMGHAESSDSSSSSSSGEPELVTLKAATINIHAETVEKYELALSANIVSYNPQTQIYNPANVTVRIRAIDQRGDVFELTKGQFDNAGLAVEYAAVEASVRIPLVFSGASDDVATASLVTATAFAAQQSLNMRLVRVTETDSSSAGGTEVVELMQQTIAFVRDGEDSKEREWIFYRSTEAVTFGAGQGQVAPPAAISGGQVDPTGAATGGDTNKDQDGWVPQGWYDEMQGTDADNPYEYGSYRDYIHESDSSSSDSSSSDSGGHWGPFSMPKIWSHFAKDGLPGRGIKTNTELYQATNSSASRQAPTSDSGWDSDPNLSNLTNKWTEAYKYLWNCEKIIYTNADGTETTEYTVPRVIAIWTKDGLPGKGIDSITNYYCISNASTGITRPQTDGASPWDTDPMAPTKNKPYLWNYEKIAWLNYGSGQQYTYTEPHVIGHFGGDGRGISSQTEYFKVSSTPDAPSTSSLTESNGWYTMSNSGCPIQGNRNNPYLWSCTYIEYTDNTTTKVVRLVSVFNVGIKPNLLRDTGFVSEDNMNEWSSGADYRAGEVIPGADNSWGCKPQESNNGYTNMLHQVVYDPLGRSCITSGKWYTLSFFSRTRRYVNQTSNKNTQGFGYETIYLRPGEYKLQINGRVSSSAYNAGVILRANIFGPQVNGEDTWTISKSISLTSKKDATSGESEKLIVDSAHAGVYKIGFQAYKSDGGTTTNDVTINWWRLRCLDDNSSFSTHFYPSVIDTAVYYQDGVRKTDAETNGDIFWPSDNDVSDDDGWTFHSVAFKIKSSFSSDSKAILFRVQKTYLEIKCPKFEESIVPTEWIPNESDVGNECAIIPAGTWVSGATYYYYGGVRNAVRVSGSDGWYILKRRTGKRGFTSTVSPASDTQNWQASTYMKFIACDAMFAEDVVADRMRVGRLSSIGNNGVEVNIADGMLQFKGLNFVNIQLGLDDDGCAVLKFYDKNGVFQYDLGPNGINQNVDQQDNYFLNYTPLGALADAAYNRQAIWNVHQIALSFWYQFVEGYTQTGNVRTYNISGTSTPSSVNGTVCDSNSIAGAVLDWIASHRMSPGYYVGREMQLGINDGISGANYYSRRVYSEVGLAASPVAIGNISYMIGNDSNWAFCYQDGSPMNLQGKDSVHDFIELY